MTDKHAEVRAFKADDLPAHDAAFDLLLTTASDSSILGLASHLLYVGEKG